MSVDLSHKLRNGIETLRRYAGQPRPSSVGIALVLAGAVLGGLVMATLTWAVGLEPTLMGLSGAALLAFLTLIALLFPSATVVLVFIAGQLLAHELQPLLPTPLQQPQFGPIQLRYSDPIIFAVATVVVVRIVRRRNALASRRWLLPLWSLMAWLLVLAVSSAGEHGVVAAFGELRAYYQYLLLVPYIILQFQTAEQRWKLFNTLVVLGALMLPIALIRGGILVDFALFGSGAQGGGRRWFTAASGLVMTHTIVSLIVVRSSLPRSTMGKVSLGFVVPALLIILVNPHRSVWLAATVAAASLVFSRIVSPRMIFTSIVITAAAIIGTVLVAPIDQTVEVQRVLQQRLNAFVFYSEDETASWRVHLWQQAAVEIRASPLTGVGFGRYFQLIDPHGNPTVASPHNAYVTLAYHSGVVGLMLYLWWIALLIGRLHRTDRLSPRYLTDVLVAKASLIILMTASAYYMAYSLEFHYFTWMFVGLGAASVLSSRVRLQ